MIGFLLILQASAANVPSPTDKYQNCVRSAVVRLERAKESASDTADAALAYCEEMRVKSRADELGSRAPTSTFSASDYREIVMKLWDKVSEIERRKALVAVFEARLK